jgi:hypothetical protein
MASFVTDYVVSHSVDNYGLRLTAHGIAGTTFPEELELLGTVAELCLAHDHKYDVTVWIAPKKNLGAVHERNGRS